MFYASAEGVLLRGSIVLFVLFAIVAAFVGCIVWVVWSVRKHQRNQREIIALMRQQADYRHK